MLQTLLLVDKELATQIADGLGMKVPTKGVEQPHPADPENNIIPHNRSMEVAAGETEKQNKRATPLPETSDALSMVLTAGKSVETRKVAFLITKKSAAKDILSFKKAIEAEGAVVELVAPDLGPMTAEKIVPDKALKSTPSVVYDAVVSFTHHDWYDDAEDVGHALKFVAQAFKHCKTIAANLDGSELISMATMNLSEGAPGIVITKKDKTPLTQRFITELGKHRHWDRADLAKTLPA